MIRRSVVLILLVALVACGAGQREQTIKGTLVSTNAARDGFVTFDAGRQNQIVDRAKAAGKSKVEVVAEIAAYREQRAAVVDLFEAAYRTIAAAAVLQDDAKSLDAVVRATELLYKALQQIKTIAADTKEPTP